MKKYLVISLLILSSFYLWDYCLAVESSGFIFMTWETDSLIPVDYQGKSLPTMDSVIKVVAEPIINGVSASNSSWEYKWYLNDELDVKGVNQRVFRFRIQKTDYNAKSYKVGVKIYSGEVLIGEKEIIINLIKPKVFISVVGRNESISQNVLNINSSQINLSAKYYFFSGISSDLKTTWHVDGSKSKSLDDNGNLVLDSSAGNNVDVTVLIERISQPLVRGVGVLTINFNSL